MPLHGAPVHTPYLLPSHNKKRKRKAKNAEPVDEQKNHGNIEYAAVITPDERVQRRLAGLPLDESPPAHPFPHTGVPFDVLPNRETPVRIQPLPSVQAHTSLKLQHVSNIMTLLHRALSSKEYVRATRALSMIIRTEISGSFVDLRHEQLWRIAGELLTQQSSDSTSSPRHAFERVKTFYDIMAIQYPWNRTWPSSTNAQDFKLAMFNLWIFVVLKQAHSMRTDFAEVKDMTEEEVLEIKRFELTETEAIVLEMDALMTTVPFIDDKEFQRLRAQVALWSADLYESIGGLEKPFDTTQDDDLQQQWLGKGRESPLSEPHMSTNLASKALEARNIASKLFRKLDNQELDSD